MKNQRYMILFVKITVCYNAILGRTEAPTSCRGRDCFRNTSHGYWGALPLFTSGKGRHIDFYEDNSLVQYKSE